MILNKINMFVSRLIWEKWLGHNINQAKDKTSN